MNDGDVTDVTRDKYAEVKLVIDLLSTAAFLYYLAHPEVLDNIGETAHRVWSRIVHRISVWTAKQDIRSLPETEDE